MTLQLPPNNGRVKYITSSLNSLMRGAAADPPSSSGTDNAPQSPAQGIKQAGGQSGTSSSDRGKCCGRRQHPRQNVQTIDRMPQW